MPRRGKKVHRGKGERQNGQCVKNYDNLPGGMPCSSCCGMTYAEAKESEARESAAPLNRISTCTDGGNVLFSSLCDEWMWLQQGRVKASTYARYITIVERHIKPRLGSCPPFAVSTQLVEVLKRSLLEEDALAPKTVRDVLMVLRSILKSTAKQYPSLSDVEFVYPREAKKEMRVLSMEEQRIMLSYLQQDMDCCKFGIMLALMTGLRIGELCALRWTDISLDQQTLRVSSTMQRLPDPTCGFRKTHITVDTPKSDTSARTIPLSESAVRLCDQIAERDPAAYVLTGTDQYMEPRTLQYRMRKYTRECGLEGVHFHTLRHTFVTRCVEAGFDIKSLSEILGHASVTVTMDRYVHSSMELKRTNMTKLSAVGL